MRRLHRFIQGLWTFLYYYLVCYFTNRPLRVEFTNALASFHRRQRQSGVFPSLELTQILPETSAIHIRLDNFLYRGGNVSFGELCTLVAVTRALKPGILFEFGTFDGNTTLQLALNSPHDAVVYTIDLPRGTQKTKLRVSEGDDVIAGDRPSNRRFNGTAFEHKIRSIHDDSATYDYSALKGKVDLIFIDGSHSYEYTENDTQRALELLAPHGIIIWHDYMVWNDVTDYLNNLSETLPLKHVRGTSLVVYKAP
jgi:predicted O-methyltransferase YrrM